VAACDWEALRALADTDEFLYDVCCVGDPVPFWLDEMGRGRDVLGEIATVLTLPAREVTFGDGEVAWVWPAIAYMDDPTDADWQALLPLYTQEEIDEIRAGGEGYAGGFHLWIAVDGTWSGAAIMSV